jgi:hypothetical protein
VSGETEASVSGWTTDTLREHLLQKLTDQRDALRQEISDQREFTRQQLGDLRDSSRVMTVDLRDSIRTQAEDHRRMLDERYATQTKALDAAFKAAEQAVAVALANAEKATTKAEAAAERRLEGMNEFRGALSDQTKNFLPRAEYVPAHNAISERLDAVNQRMSALELRLTSRLDRGEGEGAGVTRQIAETRESKTLLNSSSALIVQMLIGLVAVAALIITIAVNVH